MNKVFSDQDWAEFLLQTFFSHWFVAIVLVGLVAVFISLSKSLNATTRHNIWLITLISFLLMPLLVFMPKPDINVPSFSVVSSSSVVLSQVENNKADISESIPQSNNINESIGSTDKQNKNSEPNNPAVNVGDTPPLPLTKEISLSALLKSIFIFWLVGSLFLVRRLWGEYRAARELELQSDSVTPYFERRFKELCERLEVKEKPLLRFHAGINAPMTVGLYRVWVAIPMVWREEIDDDVFDQTLTHELGHIARKDPLVHTIQRLMNILFWMYPAIWYVSRQLELERESACDDWVLTHDGKGHTYANNLLNVAESLYLQPHVLAVGCLRSHSQLSRRIQNLLNKSSDHAIRNSRKLLIGVAAALGLSLSVSAVMWPDANEYISNNKDIIENEKDRAGEVANLAAFNESTADEASLKHNSEDMQVSKTGGTVVINGVEITQTPEGKTQFGNLPVLPSVPASPSYDVVFQDNSRNNYYTTRTVENDEDGTYSYSIGTNKSKYGEGSFSIKRKNGKVFEVEVEPKINKKNQPLLYAAWNNDWPDMKRFLKEGYDVNQVYNRPTLPRTALNAAILKGDFEMVEYLVKNGADIKADNEHGDFEDRVNNALTTAAMVGNTKIVKYLLKNDAPINDKTMIVAVQSKSVELVDLLLKNNVQMDESSLVVAVQNHDKDMVDLLLKRNDCHCLDVDSALIVAVQNRDTDMVKYLLDEGADADNSALMIAIQNRDSKMVDWLLDAGADPDEGALVIAVQNRDKKLAKRLLKAGADAGDGALVIAIQNRDTEMVDWLLDAGADPADGSIVMAVQNSDKSMVKHLLKAGADIDEGALIMAIQNRDTEMVKWLLKYGASVDDGAMIIAIQSRDEQLIELIRKEYDTDTHGKSELDKEKLQELQAMIDAGSNGFGETIETIGGVASGVLGIISDAVELEGMEYDGLALTKAIEKENISLARSLMKDGAKPNTLHLLKALEQEETDLACEMLDQGAQPDGLSLLKALEMEDLGLAKKFLDHGAEPNGLILLKAIEIGDQDFIERVRNTNKKLKTSELDNIENLTNKYSYKSDSGHRADFNFTHWPVESNKISLDFNDSSMQFTGNDSPHKALDFPMPFGAKVMVVADGKVVESEYSDSYGNYIVVDHGDGYMTKYANNKKNKVQKNEFVKQGQVIALVGNDGANATGPHLHFEVKYRHKKIDPEIFLADRS